jgi:uncharacterized phiE125 gp8 family phage protein
MTYRSTTVATPPAVEPVTLAEAKAQCRIDTTADDSYVEALIQCAREWAESYCDMTFVHTERVVRFDTFPAEIELPKPPAATAGTATAVTITYVMNDTGSTATLSSSEYRVDRDSTPAVLRPNYGQSWPSHLADTNAVSVRWWAGFGPDGSSVPQRIKSAMLMLIAYWFERRVAADATAATPIPFGVKALLDSTKWGAYR